VDTWTGSTEQLNEQWSLGEWAELEGPFVAPEAEGWKQDLVADPEAYWQAQAERAETTALESPALEGPGWEAPGFEAPDLEAPDLEAPGWEVPGFEAPVFEAPVAEAEGWQLRQPGQKMPLLHEDRELEQHRQPLSSTPDYAQVLTQVRRELALRFSDPADPRLLQRRRRLRRLFGLVPPSRTRELHARLGPRATSDELSRMFHGRLATTTRHELLELLRDRFPSPQAPMSPPAPVPVQVWPASPLPSGAEGRYRAAVGELSALVSGSPDPRVWRYRCWLAKLAAGADDRVVEWHRICPRKTGAMGAAYVVGPCDLTAGSAVDQTDLETAVRSVADVEGAGLRLGFITHIRSEILFTKDMVSPGLVLENFQRFHDEVGAAVDKLDLWANSQMGGSSAMPKAYIAIKDWIGARQRDQNSVYSCL